MTLQPRHLFAFSAAMLLTGAVASAADGPFFSFGARDTAPSLGAPLVPPAPAPLEGSASPSSPVPGGYGPAVPFVDDAWDEFPPPASPGHFGPSPSAAPAPAIMLYPCVTYKDIHKACPQGVPTVIAIRDPRISRLKSSKGQCVYIEVCLPPLCQPRVKKCWLSKSVTLDYGHHSVKIQSKKGWVTVAYRN